MPWCEECAKYLAPSAMREDGSCPKCLKVLQMPNIHGSITAKTLNLKQLAQSGEQDAKVPWHFKMLVGALIVYLSWRVVDLFR
ncbi:MAG: hypothetical protein D4R44_04325 [Actinobacteria bacterium]|nr:MAG: hypothetical protein D4R44_04325 [Actinomycetota bacterium]